MDTIGAVSVMLLVIMIFLTWPVFWLVIFGFVFHPGFFVAAFIWWALSDN